MKVRKKSIVTDAEQFLEDASIPKGVCFGWRCGGTIKDGAHVHTIHANQRVNVVFGDWIIPEEDGEHYYPCKPDIFEKTYEIMEGQ